MSKNVPPQLLLPNPPVSCDDPPWLYPSHIYMLAPTADNPCDSHMHCLAHRALANRSWKRSELLLFYVPVRPWVTHTSFI